LLQTADQRGRAPTPVSFRWLQRKSTGPTGRCSGRFAGALVQVAPQGALGVPCPVGGQAGSAADNAAIGSFFAQLQKNVPDRQRWDSRDELRIAIVTWIERTCHRRRRQATLGRLTPIEYETIITNPATQAA
jgi:putative transposase